MEVGLPEAETDCGRSLLLIARSLWKARVRLHHRTQCNVVNLNQLFVFFFLYSRHCDKLRTRPRRRPRPRPRRAALSSSGRVSYTRCEPVRPQLQRYILLAAAAYSADMAELGAAIGAGTVAAAGFPRTMFRLGHASTALNPAYVRVHDSVGLHPIVLCSGDK